MVIWIQLTFYYNDQNGITDSCRELLLWSLDDAHIDPSYLKEHEFFRTPLMTS